MDSRIDISRRDFVRAAAVAGVALQGLPILTAAPKAGHRFKVALIGCGGRGNGALRDLENAAKMLGARVRVVGAADVSRDRAEKTARRHGVVPERVFWGFTSYQRVMETDADVVLMATPPAFRPVHFEAAVQAGKHVFMEKPVAVDPPGCRRILAAGEVAKTKGLAVVAGTQRRHQEGYRRNKFLIDNGAIGTIMGGYVSWLGRIPWIHRRAAGEDDTSYMVRNWLNFYQLSGDHIVEQHVHNIDIANWFLGRPPKAVIGFGGRARRTTGNQFDFFSIDLDYGDGVHIHSQCRQIAGCYSGVREFFQGTEGSTWGGGRMSTKKDIEVPDFPKGNPYVQEHADLLTGILSGKPLNEARNVAESTLTAVIGRMSAYTGQTIRWSDVTENKKSKWFSYVCTPSPEDFEKGPITAPEDDVVPIPGSA